MSEAELVPDLVRIIQRLEDRVDALEAAESLRGAENINDLEDVTIDVLTRVDAQSLVWDDGLQAWVNGTGGGTGTFPISFDDGTYTYTIDVGTFNSSPALILSTVTNIGSVIQSQIVLGNGSAGGDNGVILGPSGGSIGFFGGVSGFGATKISVVGARDGNVALGALLTALDIYGLITDTTTP